MVKNQTFMILLKLFKVAGTICEADFLNSFKKII